MTGSGKTTLARRLLQSFNYVIAIDLKKDLKWDGWATTDNVNVPFTLKHSIYRPKNTADIARLFVRAFKEGGWYIYVDEVYLLGPRLLSARGGGLDSSPYVICLTSGRSKGVTIITSTQRPKFLPLFAVTESTHLFVFSLGKDDFKALANMAGVDVISDIAKGQTRIGSHKFLYYNRRTDTALISKVRLENGS